jgi:hypothetical protein
MPRPRFSLLTSLLVVTIVAMAIVIWQLYVEVVPLRVENRRLRDELGELSIEDDTQFHAILTPQLNPGDHAFKWRIWVPQGRRYVLRYASQSVPKQGYPQPGGMLAINDPGEQWIEYRVFKESDSGNWRDILDTQNASVSGGYQKWPDWATRTGTGKCVGTTTEVFKPDQTIELARWHIGQASSSTQITYPSAGFLIWLDPAP